MDNFTVRLITSADYKSIHNVDELTQIQYLGQKLWDTFTNEEKEDCLVSRQPNYDGFVKSGYSLLVENNGQIIGFLLAYETIPMYHEIYNEYIAINPSFQNKGIGTLLYKKLIDLSKKNNIKQIRGLINLDNPGSIKVHLKAGFKLVDRKEAVLKL